MISQGIGSNASNATWWFRVSSHEKGPFSLEEMKQHCSVGSVAPTTHVSADGRLTWDVASIFPDLWGLEPEQSIDAEGRWRIAVVDESDDRSFEFATLQMYASQGWLRRKDLVKELPDGGWRPAASLVGLFDGRRQWCVKCGSQLGEDYETCSCCGFGPQPDYERTNAIPALISGLMSLVLYFAGVSLLIVAILGEWQVMDVRVDEHYPEFFAFVLIAPVGVAAIGIFLGQYARLAIREGRDSPQFLRFAVWAVRAGVSTLLLIGLTVVAVVSFSMRHFW